MLLHPDFVVCRPQNNNYHSLRHKTYGAKLRLDFRKSVENGVVIGYGHLEVSVSPHYHFNQYRHNGNDFTPLNCIKTIIEILTYLGIKPQDYDLLKVVNIEFGLNIIPEINIKNLIDGLLFYKKTPFKVVDFRYNKRTDATSYKQLKAYAKGLQFVDFPEYGIDINTFRFEVKSKQGKNIKKYGIENANDLTKLNIYKNLNQTLLDEWENTLLINQTPDFSDLKTDESQFIKNTNKIDFWSTLITENHRNTFRVNKVKYLKILQGKNNFHQRIKLQIIDKLFSFKKCANSTQQTLIKKGKDTFNKTHPPLINLESAQLSICLVTGLDISMQKKDSVYLCITGLKYYRENVPDKYKLIERQYLNEKTKRLKCDEQLYYIAHNIRNVYTNRIHNQKSFEKRNYNQNQLRFQF